VKTNQTNQTTGLNQNDRLVRERASEKNGELVVAVKRRDRLFDKCLIMERSVQSFSLVSKLRRKSPSFGCLTKEYSAECGKQEGKKTETTRKT